jgi:spore coat polysaccharide biosynthesis predicted glycosyltransferase SpsG
MSRFIYIRDSSKELGKGHSYHSSVVSQRLAPFESEAKRDAIIIDSLVPTVGMTYAAANNAKLVLFNCLYPGSQGLADIVVTPDISPCFENVRTVYDAASDLKTTWFRGPRYWFLRDEFNLPPEKPMPFYDVGILIGGTDPLDLTERIREQLKGMRVLVLKGRDIAFQMRMCEVMLTGCGQSFWESLKGGVPAIPFASNEAQAKQYGPTFQLGEVGSIRTAIKRQEWAMPSERWQIGEGVDEVIAEILR